MNGGIPSTHCISVAMRQALFSYSSSCVESTGVRVLVRRGGKRCQKRRVSVLILELSSHRCGNAAVNQDTKPEFYFVLYARTPMLQHAAALNLPHRC